LFRLLLAIVSINPHTQLIITTSINSLRLLIISHKLVAIFFAAFFSISSQLLNKVIVLKHVLDFSHELRVGFACVVLDLLPHLRQLELAEDKLRVACFEGVF
jgi:hypothetical protein